MKAIDRLLQRWRIAKAKPWIRPGSRVLDIGCHHGELFEQLGDRIGEGVGIDPHLPAPVNGSRFRLLPGMFPAALGDDPAPFDAITLLAVLEHIPEAAQEPFARECARALAPGGVLVITVPSPLVDKILTVLTALRLIDGMSLEEHHGFDPTTSPRLFEEHGLSLVAARRFQLGLNHLFVLRKTDARAGTARVDVTA